MFDHPFPIPLDFTRPEDGLRQVVEMLLSETCIFAYPEPAEAGRPELPYSAIVPISDVPLGYASLRTVVIDTDTAVTPDVREVTTQARAAVVRLWCYGSAAFWRARLVATGYTSQPARNLWGVNAIQDVGTLFDATRLLGNHHEQVAYQDYRISYRHEVSIDNYSVKTAQAAFTIGD